MVYFALSVGLYKDGDFSCSASGNKSVVWNKNVSKIEIKNIVSVGMFKIWNAGKNSMASKKKKMLPVTQ